MQRGKQLVGVRYSILADFDALLAIKSDPFDVTWSGFATAPDPVHFREWYIRSLASSDQFMFSAVLNQKVVGYCHFIRTENDVYDTSYGVKSEYRGHGIGGALKLCAMDLVRAELPNSTFQSWIATTNTASENACRKQGYIMTKKRRKAEFLHPIKRIETMRLWVPGTK